MGLTWALEKTVYYMLGCEQLLALVDHKPLLGFLTTRNLGDIENPRLLHLAERLLKWKFTLRHIAGASYFTPDALSRFPAPASTANLSTINHVQPQDQFNSDKIEAQVLATTASNNPLLISWKNVQQAAILDEDYATLLHLVQSDNKEWPDSLSIFKRFSQDLSSVDGVVIYKGRVVVPKEMQPQILHSLHQAHQGTSSMTLRAKESVWWPQISEDLAKIRSSCTVCHKIAPSQSPMPPVSPPLPQFPFQLISSDYFTLDGFNYLIIVDRYSNWPFVKKCKTETACELERFLHNIRSPGTDCHGWWN